MNCFVKRTWVEIDLDCICHNFSEIRRHVRNSAKIMCVVKADAYGHGARYIAAELERQGADWFAVSNIDEAIQLRKYGINKPILVLGYTPVNMAEKLYNFNISQAIFSYEYAMKLAHVCKLKDVKVKGHIKIDTGMSRIGFACQSDKEIIESVALIEDINKLGTIELEGIFTHFAVSDDPINGDQFTRFQFKNFKTLTDELEKRNIIIPLKHCCNSGGIITYPEMNLDMVRAGIILYGLSPSSELKDKIYLKPAMQLRTVVSQIKSIKKGTTVSYGRTFVAPRDMRVATVPIGYADGYSRNLSGKASMLVCGKKAPVIGRVCMDQLMLDISEIEGVQDGTEVLAFGVQGKQEVSVDELADLIGTVNYELVCLIGKRVPRVYYKNAEIIGETSYM